MIGNDVEALQAVLSADAWREHLLAEEKRLNVLSVDMEKGLPEGDERTKEEFEQEREQVLADLKDVYAKLEAIESDKAESRYGDQRDEDYLEMRAPAMIEKLMDRCIFCFVLFSSIVLLPFFPVSDSPLIDIATQQRAFLEDGVCVWLWPVPCSTNPICCCWMSLQTCWIFLLLFGLRIT